MPIEKSEAKRLQLTVAPFRPTHRASEFGLIPDTSVWLESHLPPSWRVAMRLASQDGRPVVAEVRVFPNEHGQPIKEPHASAPGEWSGTYGARRSRLPSGGLTAGLLNSISLRIFRRDLHTIATKKDVTAVLQQLARADPSFPLDGAPSPTVRRRSRAGLSDRAVLRVARVYERASLAERPVTEAVAQALTLSRSKARDAISRARYLGFLLPTTKGKGGGILTEKARKLLNVKKQKGGKRHATTR